MGGFVCRFCHGDSESENGSASLEISIRNRKIIIYVCQECYPHLSGNPIIRCWCCGNIWLKKDAKMGGGVWIVAHCSLCTQGQPLTSGDLSSGMEDVTRAGIVSSDDKIKTRGERDVVRENIKYQR
jgi:hypothetical protein